MIKVNNQIQTTDIRKLNREERGKLILEKGEPQLTGDKNMAKSP